MLNVFEFIVVGSGKLDHLSSSSGDLDFGSLNVSGAAGASSADRLQAAEDIFSVYVNHPVFYQYQTMLKANERVQPGNHSEKAD